VSDEILYGEDGRSGAGVQPPVSMQLLDHLVAA
jgi:hypothetical protein